MKLGRFVGFALRFLTLTLVTVACLGGGLVYWLANRGPGGGTTGTDGAAVNHIAFVGDDGNLRLASPDGADLRDLTADGRGYRQPTWAPDGRRLAFIGPGDESATALYVVSVTTGEPIVLFEDPGAAPFYLYWSPDSRTVTFLAQEESGLALRAADADEPGSHRLLGRGSPFYWAWSPQGDWLLMHVGGARTSSEQAHLSLLESQPGASREELKLAPGRFQAPLWSSDGQYIFYITVDEQGQEAIYKTHLETLAQTLITELHGPADMVLSPDDRHLAYLQSDGQVPPLGLPYLVDTQGEGVQQLTREPVVAMYWSPDGKKLALLAPNAGDLGPTARAAGRAAPPSQRNLFTWWIYEVETGALESLATFQPTEALLQTVPFFDQYHLSLTFWSPDSRYLVTTLIEPEGGDDTVWVLDTTGEQAPRKIGEGRLAVWSWR